MQIKTTIKYHFSHTRLAKLRGGSITQRMWLKSIGPTHLETMDAHHLKLDICESQDLNILQGLFPEEILGHLPQMT